MDLDIIYLDISKYPGSCTALVCCRRADTFKKSLPEDRLSKTQHTKKLYKECICIIDHRKKLKDTYKKTNHNADMTHLAVPFQGKHLVV